MAYVQRDKNKKIVVASALPQYKGQEMLPESSAELKKFRKEIAGAMETSRKIREEVDAVARDNAIQSLKDKGELPATYTE